MKWIVITSPDFFAGEVSFLHQLLDSGVDLLHLRKPGATAEECAALLEAMTPEARRRIVTHQHFELATRYGLHGIHLNRRFPTPWPNYQGSISRSCHSLNEVVQYKSQCHYLFLSPIFNSISKEGYAAAFTDGQLRQAAAAGIIDEKVCALGGVTTRQIPQLKAWNFGGAVMLGSINALATLPEAECRAELQRVREEIGR